jgi:tripartite-type tricarboxylate transporter receptor subunit TctC
MTDMKIDRLRRLVAACTGLVALFGMQAALAQAFPSKPVRLVVTFPPGGSSDTAARIVAPRLAERLGQQVIVENRPGAGGGVGIDAVAKSPPDGHTLVLTGAGGLTANPNLYKKLSYDPVKDLAPVSTFGTSPFVLVASESLAAANIKDVITLARAQPGKLSYASGGNGTAMHLTGELIKSMSGSFIVHIPYRGTAPAVLAAMGGESQLAIADLASVRQQAKSGRIKLLGVTSKERSPLAPELPTLAESGLPGFEAAGWFAVLAPVATPPAVLARLNADLNAVLRLPEVRQQFANAGLEPLPGTQAELAQLMKSETAKWAEVIKRSGATAE